MTGRSTRDPSRKFARRGLRRPAGRSPGAAWISHVGHDPVTRQRRVLSSLGALLRSCRDASLGYGAAADCVSGTRVQRMLLHFAEERRCFGEELADAIVRLGGRPAGRGTLRGTLYRRWMRANGGDGDSGGILRACAFAEGLALQRYLDALGRGLPDEVRHVVARQSRRIAELQETLEDLAG